MGAAWPGEKGRKFPGRMAKFSQMRLRKFLAAPGRGAALAMLAVAGLLGGCATAHRPGPVATCEELADFEEVPWHEELQLGDIIVIPVSAEAGRAEVNLRVWERGAKVSYRASARLGGYVHAPGLGRHQLVVAEIGRDKVTFQVFSSRSSIRLQ